MRAVVQRVSEASVAIENQVVGKIQKGLLALVAVRAEDTEKDIDYLINKLIGLRVFEDTEGKMNLSFSEVGGQLLIVPNFTVYGSVIKGMRPSFIASGSVQEARKKYDCFIEKLTQTGINFEQGVFQANMQVSLVNDGPITLVIDSDKLF
ncbi:D-tyrosyl-tRNA(Tyr) deacylase [Sporanaerobium hydrogeniformans]|uniref:D-tyrosyl-tRNA(Tyr) deacylase n=1 Tax=Sporanaerobium hydrogeniformans TaxID=3072179 RepID=A0AC61DFU4_9FIRM|nr:D-aminoacyl-tRNA deacylase [Sporanaerobium hydrogeniformans]PHV71651.1 D-tyrosyl-tRNA(Tyr) deacylase [Sporanaerobium hydrogeniformans]